MSDAPPTRARRRWGRWVAGCLLVFALLIAAGDAVRDLRDARAPRWRRAPTAPPQPYAMVLGNRVFPGNGLSQRARLPTGDGAPAVRGRPRAARDPLRRGLAPTSGYDEPAAMAAWLEARGVPARDLILDRGGYRTASSMADAAAIGVRSLLVVSQALPPAARALPGPARGARRLGRAVVQRAQKLVGSVRSCACARRSPAPKRSSRFSCAAFEAQGHCPKCDRPARCKRAPAWLETAPCVPVRFRCWSCRSCWPRSRASSRTRTSPARRT